MSSKPKFKLNLSLSNYIHTQMLSPSAVKSFYMDFETAGFKPAEISAIESILTNSFYGCYGGKIYHNG